MCGVTCGAGPTLNISIFRYAWISAADIFHRKLILVKVCWPFRVSFFLFLPQAAKVWLPLSFFSLKAVANDSSHHIAVRWWRAICAPEGVVLDQPTKHRRYIRAAHNGPKHTHRCQRPSSKQQCTTTTTRAGNVLCCCDNAKTWQKNRYFPVYTFLGSTRLKNMREVVVAVDACSTLPTYFNTLLLLLLFHTCQRALSLRLNVAFFIRDLNTVSSPPLPAPCVLNYLFHLINVSCWRKAGRKLDILLNYIFLNLIT